MTKEKIKSFVSDIEFFLNQIEEVDDFVDWLYDFLEGLGWEWDYLNRCIILKYPDSFCTNVYGQKTPITDLYVKIDYNGNVEMRRCSFTYAQEAGRYLHSHVNMGSRLYDWSSSICFGPNMSFRESSLPFDEQLIRIVSLLPDFIETESTNHSPYAYISKLPLYSNQYRDVVMIGRVSDFISKVPIQVSLPSINGAYQISISADKELTDKWLIENNFIGYFVNNLWYKDCINEDKPETRRPIAFKFRDEPVDLVIKSDTTDTVNTANKIPCEIARQEILKNVYDSIINSTDFWKEIISSTGTLQC